MNIDECKDYRDFLKAIFIERKSKNTHFNYRSWAERLGIDTAQLFRILKKEKHLPLKYIEAFSEDLNLKTRENEIFRTMVQLSRAKSKLDKTNLTEKLLGFKDVSKKTLTREQYRFFNSWHHSTLRCLIGASNGNEKNSVLAKQIIPEISTEQVEQSIQLQLELGLLKKSKGRLQLQSTHLSTQASEINQAIRNYQSELLNLASQSLERFDKKDRDLTSLTFAVNKDTADEIVEILKECRRQIQQKVDKSKNPDRILNLSLSLFPTAYLSQKIPFELKEKSNVKPGLKRVYEN